MRTRILISTSLACFFVSSLPAQLGSIVKGIKDKRPGVTAPAAAPVTFNRESYENLKNYAEGLYKQKERPDFKLKVDREYESLLREHADRAYRVNISPHSEIKLILEDRFREFSGLYDNLMIQDLVNQIGQEVVPKWSDKLVTFKLIADPVPRAECLATGTVYITTGLAASLDNKAQLAYILAHEAAHVAKEHWKLRVLIENAKVEYAKESAENQARLDVIGSFVGMAGGAAIGGALGKTGAAAIAGGLLGALTGLAASAAFGSNDRLIQDWNQFEEDEADDVALKAMLEAKIDVREVPTLYLAVDKLSLKDDRVGMGFWGNRDRMRERMDAVNTFLKTSVKDSTGLTGNDPDFRRLIAELKRDNGILSFHYDMLEAARANLEQAVDTRQADPVALYYYAKILQATARTPEEHKLAAEFYVRAMKADSANQAYGAYLHSAIALLDSGTADQKRQAADLLVDYVERYRKSREDDVSEARRNLPPHMDTIVDYLRRAGVENPSLVHLTGSRAVTPDPAPKTAAPADPKPKVTTATRPK